MRKMDSTAYAQSLHRKINILLFVFLPLFFLAAVFPKETIRILRDFLAVKVSHLMILCMLLVLAKVFLLLRARNCTHRFLEVTPFLLLLLYSVRKFSDFQYYTWGVDDAFYYSYLPSIFIDHDLDLLNQYETSNLVDHLDKEFLETRTAGGYVQNFFPVGLSIFWAPFFLLGHGIASLLNLIGFAVPLDGYSKPYTHAVGIGNIFYACAGLYLTYLFVSKYTSKIVSMISTAGILLATPYLCLFFKIYLLVSEPLSMALVAMLFFLVQRFENRLNPRPLFLLGLIWGLMTAVRLHNSLFGFLPAAFLILNAVDSYRKKEKDSIRDSLLSFCALILGAAAGFFPQMLVWRFLYGSWIVNVAGGLLLWWQKPLILEMLFSARKGLFPWAPLLFISFVGMFLFARKEKKWGWTLIVIFFLNVYLNASQVDWWGSTTLGARRFVACSAIFVVGLSAIYLFLIGRFAKAGHIGMVGMILFFAHMNIFVANAFFAGKLQKEHADRFSDVFDRGFRSVYRFAVYPLEFPVQLYYRLRYGIKMYGPLNEFFIGEDILYFQEQVPRLVLGAENPLFGGGWESGEIILEDRVVRRTNSKICVLNIPMFVKEKRGYLMEMRAMPSENERDVWIDFYLNDRFVRSRKVPAEGGIVSVILRPKDYSSQVNLLTMHIYRRKAEDLPVLIVEEIRFQEVSRKESRLDTHNALLLNSQ